jgi:hypothetical protein
MPPVRVKSLLHQSLACIMNNINYSYFPVKHQSTTNNEMVEFNGPELGINHFHQLRK